MKFIDKLERKFGRFGIPNLTIYMIVCYVIGYALMIVNPGILNWLSLEPAYILRGQVWRLVTWYCIHRALPEYYGLQLQFCSFIIQLELLWSGRLELLNIRCIFFRA